MDLFRQRQRAPFAVFGELSAGWEGLSGISVMVEAFGGRFGAVTDSFGRSQLILVPRVMPHFE